jgi:murein DD-endopeptidase MepM/ murein hydrolase activator NlpD
MKLYDILLLILFILSGCFIIKCHEIDAKTDEIDKKNKIIVEMSSHIDSLYKILDGLPLGSPLDTVIIDDKFGIRRHPILKIWRRHWGIDLRGTYRDTIYATGAGKIEIAKWIIGYGRHVVIKHKTGYKSLYAHMNKLFVKRGQAVKRGDKIGTIGSSGLASGPHLHYEISRFGLREDPNLYLVDIIK